MDPCCGPCMNPFATHAWIPVATHAWMGQCPAAAGFFPYLGLPLLTDDKGKNIIFAYRFKD